MGAVRFSIDPDLVRKLKSLLPLRTFVETGTFEGATVRAVRPFFDEIHTVELSTPLYAQAAEAFASDSAVHVHHGSSPDLLADLTPKLRRRGVLYWLDAHWSDEEHSEGETEQCPLLGELAAIGSVSDRSIVLIDDARLFLAPPPAPSPTEGWPRFDEVSERLTALNPKHELMVIDDVIVFFPPRIREALRDYAHHHAVDWLAELQASRRMAGQNRRLENLESELASFRKEVATQDRKRSRQLDRKVETLSTTLRTLRNELAAVGERDSEELAPLEGRLESFGPQFDALEGAMRTLREQTHESQEMLEELPAARKEIKGLGRRIEPLDKQIASLGSLLERLRSDLQGLDERSQESTEALEKLPETLKELPGGRGDIEALDRRIEPLDAQIASVGTLLESLQADLHDLDQRSRESSTTLEELPAARKEIKALERRLEPLDGQIASVASLLESLQADVSGVERRSRESSATLDSQIASVGSLLESLQADIRSVETEVLSEIEAGSALTREALVGLPETRNEVAVLSSRVETIAAELEDLRPSLDEDRKAQSHRSEVTIERLGLLMRQLRSIEEQLQGKPKPQRFTRTRRAFATSRRRWGLRRRRIGRALRRFGRALGAPFRWLGMKLFGSSLGRLHHHAPRDLRIPRRYHRAAEVETAPQISIVTPSDGRASWLDRTLQSVLGQEYDRLEYIVEDFSPTEATERIIRRNRSRLAHCEVRRNGGPAKALNAGFDRATGEIMGHVGTDGILLPGALAYVAEYFDSHPAVDVIYGHRILINERDQEIGRWVLPPHDDEILSWADYVPPESLFWRRSAWEASGGELDPRLSEALDWDLLLRFREVGAQMVRVPRFLGAHRIRNIEERAQRQSNNGSDSEELRAMRSRIHGRAVSDEEVHRAVRGYIRRHVLLQKLYRLHLLRY